MSSSIEWKTEQRKLSDLAEFEKNPRQLSQHDAEHIRRSIEKFGLADPLVVNLDGQIIGGHQRKRIMLALEAYGPDAMIDVRIPSRALTVDEVAELNIRLNRNNAAFDFDILANEFEISDLLNWGFTDFEFGMGKDDIDWSEAFGGLPDGDRAPFQQMTFTLHDDQVEQVKAAVTASKAVGPFEDSPNENSNGNALARICETFVTDYGQS